MDLNLPQRVKYPVPAWKRIIALIVDLSVLDIMIFNPWTDIATRLIGSGSIVEVYNRINAGNESAIIAVFLILSMFALAYFALMQYATGQTVGGMVMSIEVVGEKKNEPAFWQCVVRNLYILPILPFILFWIADPMYYFLAKKDQRLLEALSKTKVSER
jgi:uncharacterized RDD family membrane protein YckC